MAAGPDWRPKRASLDAAAGDVTGYEALSEAKMDREVDHVAFEIPRALLSQPVLSNEDPAGRWDACGTVGVDAPSADFVVSICQTIRACFGTRPPTIEQVAQMAGVSVSTLQRRLRAEQVTYKGLVDRVRFNEARRQLSSMEVSIADVAWHLGYSDVLNFTHAFSRWTGTSPLRYRRESVDRGSF